METLNQTADPAERIRVYMQCLGIDDSNARRLSLQALRLNEQSAENSDAVEPDVLDDIFRRKEQWFDALNVCSTKEHLPGTDPFVGWRLRMILRQYPEAFLAGPSDEVLNFAAQLPDSRPVPQTRQSDMPNQSLGESPVFLQRKFWQSTISLLVNACRKLASFFRRE